MTRLPLTAQTALRHELGFPSQVRVRSNLLLLPPLEFFHFCFSLFYYQQPEGSRPRAFKYPDRSEALQRFCVVKQAAPRFTSGCVGALQPFFPALLFLSFLTAEWRSGDGTPRLGSASDPSVVGEQSFLSWVGRTSLHFCFASFVFASFFGLWR